jgi:ketosteroid isomerase-like protein
MDQLDELREKAVRMRGEYSKMMEMAASSGDTALIGEVSSSRIRMEEAESAHMAAVLTWKIRRPKRGMRL